MKIRDLLNLGAEAFSKGQQSSKGAVCDVTMGATETAVGLSLEVHIQKTRWAK